MLTLSSFPNDYRVVKIDAPHVFSLSVFEDTLYVSDWEHKAVESFNKFTGSDHRDIAKEMHVPFGITIYHPKLEHMSGPNPCQVTQ